MRPQRPPAPPHNPHAPPPPRGAPEPQLQWNQGQNVVPSQVGYSQYLNTNVAHNTQQQFWQNQPPKMNQQNAYNQKFPPVQQQQQPNDFFQYNQQYSNPNSNIYYPSQNYDPFNQHSVQPNQSFDLSRMNQYQNMQPGDNSVQNVAQDVTETDPWNWGWDDSAISEAQNVSKLNSNQNSNANILNESFTNPSEGWTFSFQNTDNNPNLNSNQKAVNKNDTLNINQESNCNISNFNTVKRDDIMSPMESVQLVKNARSDKDMGNSITFVHNPNMANETNKRNPAESYQTKPSIPVHQWSTESQPSQESSDGILSHTESSTSEDPSRSLDKTSPSSHANDNVQSSSIDRISSHFTNVSHNVSQDGIVNQELLDNVKSLSIATNMENVAQDKNSEIASRIDNLPPPNVSDVISKSPMTLPPPMSSIASGNNPFKKVGQLSHRNVLRKSPSPLASSGIKPVPHVNQLVPELPINSDSFIQQPPSSIQNYDSDQTVTNRIVHANLETTPDNSERPDNSSPIVSYDSRPFPTVSPIMHQPITENCEVAPSSDRNEYLQTGHLSEGNFNSNFINNHLSRNSPNDISNNYPPPGLQRMVLGQPETQFRQNQSFGAEEPPPGLSRMVPGHNMSPMNIYNQPGDDYLDRQVDGQTTESDSLTNSACMTRTPVYRQIDGQPTDDETNYDNSSPRDRRPVGFDRMIPGEASNDNFSMSTFQSQNFSGASDERVVTGFEQLGSNEPREQNLEGSDYSEVDTSQLRGTENSENISLQVQSSTLDSDLQREINMEGENLEDISAVSNSEHSLIRNQNMDGADMQEKQLTRNINPIDSESERHLNTNQQISNEKDRKYRDDTTGDESERDRLYKVNTAKREKDASRLRSSKERDNRYGDRRDDRRVDKDRRGDYYRSDKERMSDERRYKRNKDSRYDTEDTDYYSDRDRRHYREGSYTSSKPPRPDDRSRREDDGRRSYDRSSRDERDRRRRDDREKDRRYENYDSERDGATSRRRDKDRDYETREDDRYKRYRGPDADRNYAGSRRDRGGRDERRRGEPRDEQYRSRMHPKDPDMDEDYDDTTDREQRRHNDDDRDRRSGRYRRDHRGYGDQYYERYGYSMDPYSQQMYQQHQTYQYYEKLRMTNPQAYLEIYNKYMSGAGHNISQSDIKRPVPGYTEGYSSMPLYDPLNANRLADDRGSVHSGRSSTNGDALKDRTMLDGSGSYYYPYQRVDNSMNYLKHDTPTRIRGDQASIRTDFSDSRDFNTDASLNLYLEGSITKSDRNTPVKFGTAHIKGVISSPNMIMINPSYPSDGQAATVEIINISKLLRNDSVCIELASYPGPLIKGTTHKKTVIEYCESKIKAANDKFLSLLNATQERSQYFNHSFQASHGIGNNSDKSLQPNVTELGSIILVWELLILLLRQNGVVVGTDIAELLIKNKSQYPWKGATQSVVRTQSRRNSASSATSRSADLPLEDTTSHPLALDGPGNQDLDQDSSNDVSLDHSASVSMNNKKERKHSKDNSSSSKHGRKTSSNIDSTQNAQNGEKYVTDRFREYLLFGSGKDALEWAMSHSLWGHALFLASKLDRRTYANVMTRFANGLSSNDPLQTLYQLMSGRQPAAVTCVLDEKWGDWRPHLAMILSNASQRPDLDKKSITTLGDTLNARGDLHAAQFCYLMARVEFGKRPFKLQNTLLTSLPRLVLLGSSPTNENFAQFACNEAIIMTEIYEYACSLADDNFVLLDFQFYKYLFATRLMDYGFYDRTLFYMERIAHIISQNPTHYEHSFVNQVLQVAERLKHYDPEEHVGDIGDDVDQHNYGANVNVPSEKAWISNLRQTINSLNAYNPNNSSMAQAQIQPENYGQSQVQPQYQYDQTQNWNPEYNYNQIPNQQVYGQMQNEFQGQQYVQDQQHAYIDQTQTSTQNTNAPFDMSNTEKSEYPQLYDPNFMHNKQYNQENNMFYPEQETIVNNAEKTKEETVDYRTTPMSDNNHWNQDIQHQPSQVYGYSEPETVENKSIPVTTDDVANIMEPPRPQISIPNSSSPMKYSYDNDQDDESKNKHKPSAQQKAKEKPKKEEPTKTQSSSGWFGGIFNKLSLKPKNQMILPDDKNPSIVWDSEKKKWVNLEADEEEHENQLAPPPKIPISNMQNSPSNMPPVVPESGAASLPLIPTNAPNMFKLQKGRHVNIKKSYVDVFNPSGAPTRALPPPSEVLGSPQPTSLPTTYFVPQQPPVDSQMAPSFYNPADYPT